jgi:hypothetical protein
MVGQGDAHGYRTDCRRLLRDFGQSHKPDDLYLLARILALAPEDVTEPARAVAMAEKAVAARPGEAGYVHTLAVAHYRAGQFDQAVQRPQASQDFEWGAHVVDWLLLAMAQQRLGQGAEARQSLERAVQWIDQANRGKPAGAAVRLPVPSLTDHLEVQFLRREAEELIQGKPPDKKERRLRDHPGPLNAPGKPLGRTVLTPVLGAPSPPLAGTRRRANTPGIRATGRRLRGLPESRCLFCRRCWFIVRRENNWLARAELRECPGILEEVEGHQRTPQEP